MKRTSLKRTAWHRARKPHKPSSRKIKLKTIKSLRAACDALIQQINRKKYEKCFICGSSNQVAHHFFPKSVSSFLRYNAENLVPLCNGCHMRLHQSGDPRYEQMIVSQKGEAWYQKLENHARDYIKVDRIYYEEIKLRLEKEYNELL